MHTHSIALLLFSVSMICGAETFVPRNDYGAKLEPKAHVLHGVGQCHSEDFIQYCDALDNAFDPVIFMDYCGVEKAGRAFADQLGKKLEAMPNRTLVQLGLSMTTDGKPEEHYEHAVAAGDYDANLAELFDSLKALNVPLYIRIGYECNGAWNGYQPRSYKKAFHRVTRLLRESGLNAATVWCVIPHAPDEQEDWFDDAMRYYPGDDWVDWWAVDLFSPEQIGKSKPFFPAADFRRKPVMIGESTPKGVGVNDGQQSWDEWFAPYFQLIRDNPGIKAFCYINWDWSKYPQWNDWGDARLQQNPEIADLYKKEMSLPLYRHAVRQ